MRALRLLAASAMIAATLACRATAPATFGAERREYGVSLDVIVTNMNWATINVYVVYNSGSSHWLGMVETGRTERLTVPPAIASLLDLRLAVHPVGSRQGYTTDRLPPSDGMTVELTVENNLELSHWEVRDLHAGIPRSVPGALDPESEMGEQTMKIEIPESIRLEHEEIHEALTEATHLPGPVGDAARELAHILHPHFVREEEIALPPLGLLERLALGEYAPWMRDVLPMTDSLAVELPDMLREHETIGAAAVRLERVAREHGAGEVQDLARKLQQHARAEEEVFYPAAVLVGEVVRARGTETAARR